MLLPAAKLAVVERAYARYGRRLLRRAFARVHVGGADWPAPDGPTIAFLNHGAWWDPIVTLYLSHDLFRRDGYGIMQGAQLVRYPFFRRIGCFGATTDAFEDARAVAAYAGDVLATGERRTLWLFPQGELLPARAALRFRSGLARISRAAAGVPLVPVALRYELRGAQRPELFVRVGEPVAPADARAPTAELTRRLEARLRHELASLDADLEHAEPPGYRVALEGRGSLSALYDRTFGRWARRSAETDGNDDGAAGPRAPRPHRADSSSSTFRSR